MSLNHKRRIFRQTTLSLPSLARWLPSPGVLMATAGGAAMLLAVAALFVRSSEAPAHAPASSQLSAGPDRVAVLDGDTIRLGDQLVRLEGIVAPVRGSLCHSASQGDLDCGSAAANALASMLRGNSIGCTIHGHDAQGRPVGDCLAGDKRLSEFMVLDGWARAATAGLREQETTARTAGRGIWRTGS